ncbi:MAG: hypothetical protein J2P36_13850, partial [Ktedonobacteraceae bacterium]|nr:hypothetical protein [Ktedonobacteraceae bacterium]
ILGALLGGYLIFKMLREGQSIIHNARWHRLADRVDPANQPLLATIVTIPWTHWLFAFLAGWTVFLVLFSILFSNIPYGVADGIWQGLYYWIQQIAVARGNQPWYYYLLLIPLYEQIGVVFGLVGVVRCLLRPTRFRLFLVYWLVGNFFIYSWAAEKMPWLMIHVTMPMLLLAALGLEPAVQTLANAGKSLAHRISTRRALAGGVTPPTRRLGVPGLLGATVTALLALLLLAPTLQNMYQVTYVHPADGPHEMMIYVQTTYDINKVMARVDELDQKLYHGSHQLHIGLTENGMWPLLWYVRDYPHVCYPFPTGCSSGVQVIIAGQEEIGDIVSRYATSIEGKQPEFLFKAYHMRSWWDEGYKPPPACIPSSADSCAGKDTSGGVGLGIWLSYGSNPPRNAHFDLGRAVNNVWQWWWQRKAIGGNTDGTYDMGLFIRTGLGVTP